MTLGAAGRRVQIVNLNQVCAYHWRDHELGDAITSANSEMAISVVDYGDHDFAAVVSVNGPNHSNDAFLVSKTRSGSDRLLLHFLAEAVPSGELKVLSDIDDTFYANWIDRRYPEKTIYPGVRQFYAELDQVTEGGRHGDLAFLTARPGDRAGLFEGATHESLRRLGIKETVVLAGDLPHVATHEDAQEAITAMVARVRRQEARATAPAW